MLFWQGPLHIAITGLLYLCDTTRTWLLLQLQPSHTVPWSCCLSWQKTTEVSMNQSPKQFFPEMVWDCKVTLNPTTFLSADFKPASLSTCSRSQHHHWPKSHGKLTIYKKGCSSANEGEHRSLVLHRKELLGSPHPSSGKNPPRLLKDLFLIWMRRNTWFQGAAA